MKVKQASAATLVAIEVDPIGILTLHIDARTFHRLKLAHARFNEHTYAFDGVPDTDITVAQQERQSVKLQSWVVAAWRGRHRDEQLGAKELSAAWGIGVKGAAKRADEKLTQGEAPLISLIPLIRGKAKRWQLTPVGNDAIEKFST